MKGNYIYIFLLGFQCALGIVYMGHKFFSGGTSFDDNEHASSSSSSLSEEDITVLAVNAAQIFLGDRGVFDVNLSGSSTNVKSKSDTETFKKKEIVDKEEKSLRSDGDANKNDINTHHGSTRTHTKGTGEKEAVNVKKTKKKSLRSDTNKANDTSFIGVGFDVESLGIDQTANVTSAKNIGHERYMIDKTFLDKQLKPYRLKLTEVSLSDPWRNMRESGRKYLTNWSYVSKGIQETGHPYCSLYRDNWVCAGERYKRVLRNTPLFDHSFDLNSFPSNSNIYIEGNSWMGQLVTTIICNTNNVRVWLMGPTAGIRFIVHSEQSGVSLVLIANSKLQNKPNETMQLLKSINFDPDYIVRGNVNHDEHPKLSNMRHMSVYREAFPNATYTPHFGRRLPQTCEADFTNCKDSNHGHTCTPGPINSYAQDFVSSIQNSGPAVTITAETLDDMWDGVMEKEFSKKKGKSHWIPK